MIAALAQYRADMLTALQPLLTSPTNGGFLSTCVQHCHQVSAARAGGASDSARAGTHSPPRPDPAPTSEHLPVLRRLVYRRPGCASLIPQLVQ
jgi:hypothetical protein